MKNSIRCCISCILPCGALDVIRIVHSNGKVEEISGNNIKASEIMKLYPKHVLKKPSSSSYYSSSELEGVCPKIVIVPPDAQLQRGKIYFLIPVPSNDKTTHSTRKKKKNKTRSSSQSRHHGNTPNNNASSNIINNNNNLVVSDDQYLSEILSEKNISTQRDSRRGRVAVWRPHLESISETPSNEA